MTKLISGFPADNWRAAPQAKLTWPSCRSCCGSVSLAIRAQAQSEGPDVDPLGTLSTLFA